MLGAGDKVALFGRFRRASRAEIAARLAERGVHTVKDLTRGTSVLVIGSGARNLIPDGRLPKRLAEARDRGIPVLAEVRLLELLTSDASTPGAVPVSLPDPLADLLNAFDLIRLDGGQARFADADLMRNAGALVEDGLDDMGILRALTTRQSAPRGRHRVSTDAKGAPVLTWEDGVTTLTGQGLLPLEEEEGIDDTFEQAMEAEASGHLALAVRLYESCTSADRRDPIAPFNLGNVLISLGELKRARLFYELALSRDAGFAEAAFNLAGVLERQGDDEAAITRLKQAIEVDAAYADPRFNLAQLLLKQDDESGAREEFRAFIHLSANEDLKSKARKALKLLAG